MRKGETALILELMGSIGISSWAYLKNGYYPWPPTIMRTCLAYAMLAFLGLISAEFAGVVGGGLLLAQLVTLNTSGNPEGPGKGGGFPDALFKNFVGPLIFPSGNSTFTSGSLFAQLGIGLDGHKGVTQSVPTSGPKTKGGPTGPMNGPAKAV